MRPGAWAPAVRAWLVGVLGACLAGCAAVPRAPSVNPPSVELSVDRLRDARFILLGEVHDNPEHHRQRAELLRQLLADGRPTRVVFEQMDRRTDAALAAAARDAESVADAGELDRAGWLWPRHRPLVQAALAGGATISGGNFDRHLARRLVREGLPAAPRELRQMIEMTPWSPAQDQAVRQAIEAGHCGMLPPEMVTPMALVQRLRDAALAQAMLRAGESRVVLMAGNGHVRSDLGVPQYLHGAGVLPQDIVALGFVEEGDRATPFDLQQITPAVARPDPCAGFRHSQ